MNEPLKIRIAQELLNSCGFMGCHTSNEARIILNKICNGRPIYDSRNDIYLFILEYLKDDYSQDALILIFDACRNLPVSFRPLSVEIGNEIIKNARSNDEAAHYKYRVGIILYDCNLLVEAEKFLAEVYEEYPNNYLYCRWLAEVYVKMNNLDKALSILYDYKNGPFFKPIIHTREPFEPSLDNTPITYINGTIKIIEEKKARGYVFRSRKKRSYKSVN